MRGPFDRYRAWARRRRHDRLTTVAELERDPAARAASDLRRSPIPTDRYERAGW